MEVNIEVECTRGAGPSEPLNECYRASLRFLFAQSCFFDEMRSNCTVHYTQHLAHQFGTAGEQESKLKGETQNPLPHRLVGGGLRPPAGLRFRPCAWCRNWGKTHAVRLKRLLLVQLNATRRSWWQELHCTRRNPYSNRPHFRNSSNSFFIWWGKGLSCSAIQARNSG